MRNSTIYLGCLSVAILMLAFLVGWKAFGHGGSKNEAGLLRQQMVRDLQLTDLCLFTEARYTRHLSQADLFSAFQDHPLALDHFPSGSMVRPPATLTEDRRALD